MKLKKVVAKCVIMVLCILYVAKTVNAQDLKEFDMVEVDNVKKSYDEWEGSIEREKNTREFVALSSGGKWIKSSDGRWWYQHSDGTYTKNGWEYINGYWYHFDAEGWMMTGWFLENDCWYYLRSDGTMAVGWVKVGDYWYYCNTSGVMQKGWLLENGYWYYLRSDGTMAVGWVKVGDYWYYCNTSGVMQKGWLNLNGTRYYLNASGAMQIGWKKIAGKFYYFDSSGAQIEEKMKNVDNEWSMLFAVPEGGWSAARVRLDYTEYYVKIGNYGHFVEHHECEMHNCSGATEIPEVYMDILTYSNGMNVYPWESGQLIYDGLKWNSARLEINYNKYSFAADTQVTGKVSGLVYCRGALVPTKAMSVSQRLNVK